MSRTFDPTIQTEDIGFKPDEMVACPTCARANPPNRINCLYCARDLGIEITPEHIKGGLRRPEPFERGWNVIALEGTASDEAAGTIGLARDVLTSMLTSGEPLPVARVESEQIAGALSDKLLSLGMVCRTVSDEDLSADRSPVRLRRVELRGSEVLLTDFNTEATTAIEWGDLALLVSGTLLTGRTDSVEKKRRRNKEGKVTDSMEVSSDEQVLDIYSRSDATGFRIHTAGFDFSCLGEAKKLLAVENLAVLTEKLKERAPGVRHRDRYRLIDHLLSNIWPIDERKDAKGLVRSGFGKQGFGSMSSTSNLTQYNRYSRLQWHLL